MVRFFLKALPALFLAALPIMTVVDWIAPSPETIAPLKPFGNQVRFCVGFASTAGLARAGHPEMRSTINRSYLLFPRILKTPRVVYVSAPGDGHQATVEESAVGFWLLVLAVGLCGWATWTWWIAPCRVGGLGGLRRAI
jgi:hypothetical protein